MRDRVALHNETECMVAAPEPLRIQHIEVTRTGGRARTIEEFVAWVKGPERFGFDWIAVNCGRGQGDTAQQK